MRDDGQEAIIGAHAEVWAYGAIFAESARLARLRWVTAEEIRVTNGLIGELVFDEVLLRADVVAGLFL